MADRKTRVDYDQMTQIAKLFADRHATQADSVSALRKTMSPLEGGGWVGKAATAFFVEMRGTVLPSMDRMVAALQQAANTTETVAREFKAAEDAAARVLNGQNVQNAPAPNGADGAAGGQPAPSTGNEQSTLYEILDFLTSPNFQGPRDVLLNVVDLIADIKPWIPLFRAVNIDEINKIIDMAPAKGWDRWLLPSVSPEELKFLPQLKDALGIAARNGDSIGKTLLKRLPLIMHIVDQGFTIWKHVEAGTAWSAEMFGEMTKNTAFFAASAATTAAVVAGVGAILAGFAGAPVAVPAIVVAGIGILVSAGFAWLDNKYGGAISGWFTDRFKDAGNLASQAGDWLGDNVGAPISRWAKGISLPSFGW